MKGLAGSALRGGNRIYTPPHVLIDWEKGVLQ
jgi:hypothetical protein